MPVVGFSFRQRTSYYYHDMWAYHTFTLGRGYTVMTQHSGTWGSIGAIFLISLVIPMPLNNHFFRAISYQTRLRMVLCVSCYYLPYMLGSISIQQSHLPNFFYACVCGAMCTLLFRWITYTYLLCSTRPSVHYYYIILWGLGFLVCLGSAFLCVINYIIIFLYTHYI